jgi:hypothetical protein
MNMTPLEERIMEEARKRASKQLEGFSILPLLEPFGLSLDTTLNVDGPWSNRHISNSVNLTIEQLNESLSKAKDEAREIAKELVERLKEFAR